jgi:septal ring factor EnvC (AmiA/AmiB activator)
MSYSEIMLDVYEKEIETLQKKLSLVDDDIDKLKKEIADKDIIIKLLKNKNKAYDKFN